MSNETSEHSPVNNSGSEQGSSRSLTASSPSSLEDSQKLFNPLLEQHIKGIKTWFDRAYSGDPLKKEQKWQVFEITLKCAMLLLFSPEDQDPTRAGAMPLLPPVEAQTSADEMVAQQYKSHILSCIHSYEKQSRNRRIIHNILQLIIFIGAAVVTIIVGIQDIPKLFPALLSGGITIATAIANYYKFGERGRDLYLTAEDLAQEYNWFATKRGIYKDKEGKEAQDLFMDRTEAIIRKQTQRSFILEQLKTEK